MLAPVEQVAQSEDRYRKPSIAKKPTAEAVEPELAVIEPPTDEAPPPQKGLSIRENLIKRKEMIATLGQEPVEFAFERAIGKNDSVYSNFCDLILLAKRKVGRIVVKDGNRNVGYATGFMVSERLLLTNWHVFESRSDVGESEVEFHYELDVFGRPTDPVTFKLAPDDFFYSFKELDYCLVAVSPLDVSGKVELSTIGYHYLDPAVGKLAEEGKELLNIIHHPDGDYQQLSIRENRFTKILENTIWYETDTAQGSSGSPVFNDQWQVVALHHMGVPAKTADGKNYADKDGKPVPVVDGKIDTTKICWIANEGIRISVLLIDVLAKFPNDAMIAGLKKASEPNALPPAGLQISNAGDGPNNEDRKMERNDSDDVRVAFPAKLVTETGNVSFNISTRATVAAALSESPRLAALGGLTDDELLEEAKKLQLEKDADYSQCKGYNEEFLGTAIPIPKPKKSILKFVAKNQNGTSILDYFYFSTIHHSVRKMPMISAINVDGDPNKRLDEFKRVDTWLRDNRLDYEVQLDDKWYRNSHFDKGHLSRREDADYGKTAEEAKLRADMTCVYTNACPQVAALNQSKRKGLWGKLEIKVLEKGIVKEKGKFSKISVFNGPIFSEDDRFFRGIQVPMEFWKVILWFNENKDLRATAFKLSQSDLVGDIKFEKLDFDTDAEFHEFQCSITSLEKATHLDFSAIKPFDTFDSSGGNEMLRIDSEESFENFVNEAYRVS
jgi:endonuclease G